MKDSTFQACATATLQARLRSQRISTDEKAAIRAELVRRRDRPTWWEMMDTYDECWGLPWSW